jgi:hypothetical protein
MEAEETKDDRRATGVYEWATASVNIQTGCEHDCRYCYARWDAVTRRKQCTREQWREPRIHADRIEAKYHRLKGRVMFPSTSDITPRNINECLVVIEKLLTAGNELLIVSKPHLECVQLLCEVLHPWQRHVMFRFTLGSTRDKVLSFWEPGAPSFESRIKSLSCAYMDGYRTSISCEPFLDVHPAHIQYLFEECYPYLSDDPVGGFWIGKLRRWSLRVDLSGATPEEIQLYVEPLRAAQGDGFIKGLVRRLDGRRFIKWKDSIREVIEKERQRISATESTEDTEKIATNKHE